MNDDFEVLLLGIISAPNVKVLSRPRRERGDPPLAVIHCELGGREYLVAILPTAELGHWGPAGGEREEE